MCHEQLSQLHRAIGWIAPSNFLPCKQANIPNRTSFHPIPKSRPDEAVLPREWAIRSTFAVRRLSPECMAWSSSHECSPNASFSQPSQEEDFLPLLLLSFSEAVASFSFLLISSILFSSILFSSRDAFATRSLSTSCKGVFSTFFALFFSFVSVFCAAENDEFVLLLTGFSGSVFWVNGTVFSLGATDSWVVGWTVSLVGGRAVSWVWGTASLVGATVSRVWGSAS